MGNNDPLSAKNLSFGVLEKITKVIVFVFIIYLVVDISSGIFSTMDSSNPTRGQVERTLSQRIQALYRNQLGHQPSKVTCQIFDTKIAIVLDDAITPPEQLLVNSGQEELAEQVRSDLDKAFQPKLKALIEEVVGVPVIDLLSDATLETGRTGTIAVLANLPQLRNPS